jgi:hypothetical protein
MKFDSLVSHLNDLFLPVLTESLEQDPYYQMIGLFKDIVKSFEDSDKGITGLQELLKNYFQKKIEVRNVSIDKEDEAKEQLFSLQDDVIDTIRGVFIPWDKKRFEADKLSAGEKHIDAEYSDRIDKALEVGAIEKGMNRSEMNRPVVKDSFLEFLRMVFKTQKILPLVSSKPLAHQLSGNKKVLFDEFKRFNNTRDESLKKKLETKFMQMLPSPLKDKFQSYVSGDITERDMVEAIRLF